MYLCYFDLTPHISAEVDESASLSLKMNLIHTLNSQFKSDSTVSSQYENTNNTYKTRSIGLSNNQNTNKYKLQIA